MSKKNCYLYTPLIPPTNNNNGQQQSFHQESESENEEKSNTTFFSLFSNLSQISFPAAGISIQELSQIAPGPPDFDLQEVYFPKEICKKQVRRKQKGACAVNSTQRPNSDDIKFDLIFKTKDCNNIVADIDVNVFKVHNKAQSRVKSSWRWVNNTIRLEINMNEVEDNKIYKLLTTPNMEKKKYYFTITVKYSTTSNDHFQRYFPTHAHKEEMANERTKQTDFFYLIGSEQTNESKRARTTASVSSADSALGTPSPWLQSPQAYSPPLSLNADIESPPVPQEAQAPSQNAGDVAHFSNIIAERIQTETLEVGEIKGQVFTTPHHDIGYHFELNDDEEKFNEGEVVGLLPDGDDKDKGTQRLRVVKLTSETASQCNLKGVITNSPYIEAYCPKKDSNKRTIIICMLGIVPVQVIGSVRASEFLYAAPGHPGLAISGYHLRREDKREANLVGIAVNSVLTKNELSVGVVEAGVSLMQAASQHLVNEKLREMETGLEHKILTVKKSAIRWRRVFTWLAVIFVIFLILASAYVFQLYWPGSAYRKYKCMLGHKEPLYKAQVIYVPYAKQDILITTNGIEFEYDELIKKIREHKGATYRLLAPMVGGIKIGKPRFFLGFNRCAYGNSFAYAKMDGTTVYSGVIMFAVDETCTYAFLYNGVYDTWTRFNSAGNVEFPGSVRCGQNATLDFPEANGRRDIKLEAQDP